MNGISQFKSQHNIVEMDLIPYGSRVYGTQSDKSDYDFMAIVPSDVAISTGYEFRHDNVNIHVYKKEDWQHQLTAHKIHTLEAYFHPDKQIRDKFNFVLDLGLLRSELSAKASHSFVKAKKKIDVEKDFYVGWKSLFHSLRILTFGKQIASYGSIYDYSAANEFWFDILNDSQYKWTHFKNKYQPIYNQMATDFRKVAPKND